MIRLYRVAKPAILILLIAGIIALAAFAVRSSKPSQAQHDQERTEESNAEKATQEQEKSIWTKTREDPVSLYTAALVVLTGALVLVAFTQIYFLFRADKTARIAAEASSKQAAIAERALTSLERPYVMFEYVSQTTEDWKRGSDHLRFVFRFINYGKSPAIIRNISADAILGPQAIEADLPPGAPYQVERVPDINDVEDFHTRRKAWAIVKNTMLDMLPKLPQMEGFPKFVRDPSWRNETFILNAGEATRDFAAEVHTRPLHPGDDKTPRHPSYDFLRVHIVGPFICPWLIGRISYDDFFGISHFTSFCIRSESPWRTIIEEGGPPYNERT